MPDTKAIHYRIVELAQPRKPDERGEVIERLAASPACIAPKYFYDELGCALYAAICRLPEYYPTRVEAAIFHDHRGEIAAAAGKGRQLVDLGAGDGGKAQAWIPFLDPARYIAVDIAADEIERSLCAHVAGLPGVGDAGRGGGLRARPAPRRGARRARGHVLLPGLEHRQLRARRGARVRAPRSSALRGRAAAAC